MVVNIDVDVTPKLIIVMYTFFLLVAEGLPNFTLELMIYIN